jgi:hypothetical protein
LFIRGPEPLGFFKATRCLPLNWLMRVDAAAAIVDTRLGLQLLNVLKRAA